MKRLTHTDNRGKAVMVDVGDKEVQKRIARASGHIILSTGTINIVNDNLMAKGDVLTVAKLAGINAAKQTSLLIPLCHNLLLEKITVDLSTDDTGIAAVSEIKCTAKTGVEMEALTAVSVALLTVYDMCKAVDRNMIIDRISLIEKIKI